MRQKTLGTASHNLPASFSKMLSIRVYKLNILLVSSSKANVQNSFIDLLLSTLDIHFSKYFHSTNSLHYSKSLLISLIIDSSISAATLVVSLLKEQSFKSLTASSQTA